MTVSNPDVQLTLQYRADTAIARLLPTGLLLIFLSLVIFILMDVRDEPLTLIGVIACLLTGAAVLGVALRRRYVRSKPIFALSPAGMYYRIPWVKELIIPWSEIKGVDSVDVEGRYWSSHWHLSLPTVRSHPITFRSVTVILLSKPFYDRWIHVDSPILRGPGWDANFVPKGDLVQMSLHHEYVSTEPTALREAVEARWKAFRGDSAIGLAKAGVPRSSATRSDASAPVTASPPSTPKSYVVAMGESPKTISGWQSAQIIVLLIGIAAALSNIAGLWELSGKSNVDESRAQQREQQQYWQDANKRNERDRKIREAEQKELQRGLEKDLRRPLGVGR